MTKRRFKTAFILGAGLGTRLKPLTDACPKPLLPIRGRPIITHVMDHLLSIGVDRFIVNTHHYPDAYEAAFPERVWRGAPVIFRYEPLLLDTGGGLKNIEDLLDQDDAIICYNGDIMTDLDLTTLLLAHESHRPEATLVLRSQGPLLNVTIDEKGAVCDLRHLLGARGVQDCLFSGICTVERSILQYAEKGRIESVVDLFLRRISQKPGSIRGVVIDSGNWDDVGSVEVYQHLNKFDLQGEA